MYVYNCFKMSIYLYCLKVSRCGMIFMEPISLGWECLVQSWIKQLSSYITSHYKQILQTIILRFSYPILYFLRRCNITVTMFKQ